MGCDIHAHVEHKVYKRYEGFAHFIDLDRNYVAFSLMAGVRNHRDKPLVPMVAPRGFPEDAGWRTKDAYTDLGPDAHTPSFLTLAELERLAEEYARVTAESFPGYSQIYGGLAATIAMMRELDEPRLVFWFDN